MVILHGHHAFGHKVAKVLILLAVVTIVIGVLVKNPMVFMSERALDREISGLLKKCVTWFNGSILLVSSANLPANGDSDSIIFWSVCSSVLL
jgi:hypothetical protein